MLSSSSGCKELHGRWEEERGGGEEERRLEEDVSARVVELLVLFSLISLGLPLGNGLLSSTSCFCIEWFLDAKSWSLSWARMGDMLFPRLKMHSSGLELEGSVLF